MQAFHISSCRTAQLWAKVPLTTLVQSKRSSNAHRFSEMSGRWGLCHGEAAAAMSSECIIGSFVPALVGCQASLQMLLKNSEGLHLDL